LPAVVDVHWLQLPLNAGISPDGTAVPEGAFVPPGQFCGYATHVPAEHVLPQPPWLQHVFELVQYHPFWPVLAVQPVQLPLYRGTSPPPGAGVAGHWLGLPTHVVPKHCPPHTFVVQHVAVAVQYHALAPGVPEQPTQLPLYCGIGLPPAGDGVGAGSGVGVIWHWAGLPMHDPPTHWPPHVDVVQQTFVERQYHALAPGVPEQPTQLPL